MCPRRCVYAAERGLIDGDVAHATYFLSATTIAPTDDPGMAHWRKKIFVGLARNAANSADVLPAPLRPHDLDRRAGPAVIRCPAGGPRRCH